MTEFDNAKKAAAGLLSQKMYTCDEIFQRLVRKGFSKEISEVVVAEFAKAGILNDEEYARLYIHDSVCVNMKGIHRVRQELLRKGIASSVIEKAEREMDFDANEQLESYAELRFGDKVFGSWKELEKAKAHLVRRGFSIYDVNKCFDKLGIKVMRSDESE